MLAIGMLFILLGATCFAAWRVGRARGFVSASCLYLVSFGVYYPASGLAHLMFPDNPFRGFFDLYRYVGGYSSFEFLLLTWVVAAVALVSCIVGVGFKPFAGVGSAIEAGAFRSLHPSKGLLVYGSLLLAVGALASVTLFGQVDYFAIDRGRRLEGGVARYAFMSAWFSLGVSILFAIAAAWLRNRFVVLSLFLLSALLIGLNLYWTGGRSVVLLFLTPSLLMVARYRKSEFRLYAAIAAVLVLCYVVYMTELRIGAYQNEPIRVSELLDWQFGRYSMLGHAVDYVERKGFLFGQTLGYGVLATTVAPLQLVGLGIALPEPYSITGVIGQDLFVRWAPHYIVPGIFAEGYINFGLFGVALMGAFGGWVARLIDMAAYKAPRNAIIRGLFLAYLTAVLCLNYLNSTFQAALNYTFYYGAPFVVPILLSLAHRVMRQAR